MIIHVYRCFFLINKSNQILVFYIDDQNWSDRVISINIFKREKTKLSANRLNVIYYYK